MKISLIIWVSSFIAALLVSVALANPDMLPKHPGYPMGKSVDPVNGQRLANDPGQMNASGENALVGAARSDDAHSSQHLSINQNDERLLEKTGAGILPKVQGPNIKIEPPVKEATKINVIPQ
jgi:parvulin-like peptidyl-prolyl isomerase